MLTNEIDSHLSQNMNYSSSYKQHNIYKYVMNGFLSDVALENLLMITYIKFDLEMREQIYLFLLGGTEHKPSRNGIVVFTLYNPGI